MNADLVDEKNLPYQNRDRDLKEHERTMLRLVQGAIPSRPIDVLDVGCADGLFLEALSRQVECRTVHGLDNDPALVSVARARTYRADHSRIVLESAWALAADEPAPDSIRYDVIIASGILAFFEDQEGMIRAMCRHLASDGTLFVFNKIMSADVDMRYAVRPSGSTTWGESRLVPSLRLLTESMSKYLRDVTVERFELSFDLVPTSNVHSTRTVRLADGSRMLVTNYNLVSELAFIYGARRN